MHFALSRIDLRSWSLLCLVQYFPTIHPKLSDLSVIKVENWSLLNGPKWSISAKIGRFRLFSFESRHGITPSMNPENIFPCCSLAREA